VSEGEIQMRRVKIYYGLRTLKKTGNGSYLRPSGVELPAEIEINVESTEMCKYENTTLPCLSFMMGDRRLYILERDVDNGYAAYVPFPGVSERIH
jgi:hypothetical protein